MFGGVDVNETEARSGVYVNQGAGVKAFIPKPLPPQIHYDSGLRNFLSEADTSLAELNGLTTYLPNNNMFIYIFIRKEALLSSQIEGTQATMEGFLEYENNIKNNENPDDIEEVANYVKAMNYGIERLKEFPMSLRLFKEIHRILLHGTRGNGKDPGEFRRTQNWIGPANSSISTATFVPPPPNLVIEKLGELESFIYEDDNIPYLIKAALIHAQFQTIHPFLDGNGRLGRLLITFFLYWKGRLNHPVLYMSYFFKQHKSEYYEHLMDIRNRGLWEKWIQFFLKGVIESSETGLNIAKQILNLQKKYETSFDKNPKAHKNSYRFLKILFDHPYMTVKQVQDLFDITYTPAQNLIKQFVDMGVLSELKEKSTKTKVYSFREYLELIVR